MHDNAAIHTVKKVKRWFDENEIDVMEWPSCSSDLNLIEHLWFSLKKEVYDVRSDIDVVIDGDDTIRDELFQAVKEAWPMIDDEIMRELIGSMSRRIRACI